MSGHAASSVLYHDASNSVVLLDIPTSIALAQGSQKNRCFKLLSSCHPLLQPYPSNEPKTTAARAKFQQPSGTEVRIDQAIQKLVSTALCSIKADYHANWCLDRSVFPEQEQTQLSFRTTAPCPQRRPKSRDISSQQHHTPEINGSISPSLTSPPLVLSSYLNQISSYNEIHSSVVRNSTNDCTLMRIGADSFIVPPSSTFLLSSVERSRSIFTQTARRLLPATPFHGAGEFDFILLDPPWSNRSVRRSRAYLTSEYQENDPWAYISSFLGQHLAPAGLVGVWTTNKPSVKSEVLGTFQKWGVSLVEVWIWVKTTVFGEPMLPLDGLWRKPYEILILGRRNVSIMSRPSVPRDPIEELINVRKRVIAAVPDLHSRKPCVKEMIEPCFLDRHNYRALEVFARHLTAGWWSWGDEVLKFNLERCWVGDSS